MKRRQRTAARSHVQPYLHKVIVRFRDFACLSLHCMHKPNAKSAREDDDRGDGQYGFEDKQWQTHKGYMAYCQHMAAMHRVAGRDHQVTQYLRPATLSRARILAHTSKLLAETE